MKTKERILETAIRLFNEQGAGAISTNHIAEALSMSPGNLYYYFRNKEEIIRSILERMITQWEKRSVAPSGERPPTVADVQQIVTDNFLLLWEYRFFYRALNALVKRDPVLRDRYQSIRRERLVNLETLLRQLGPAPSLPASASVTNLARLCWLISDYWLPFLEIEGELVLSEVIEQGRRSICRYCAPRETKQKRFRQSILLKRTLRRQKGIIRCERTIHSSSPKGDY